MLGQYVDINDGEGAGYMASLLARHGRLDEAITMLRQHVDASHWHAANSLVDLLAEHNCVDELRMEVAAGTHGALERFAELANEGRVRSQPDLR